MKFDIKGNLAEFVNGCDTRETLSKDCNELSYGELKRLWKQHKDSQNRFSCIHELLQGCDIKWDNLYHQKKVKSPEELKAYKARLQELEYRQLTKSMEKQKTDYFKVGAGLLLSFCMFIIGMKLTCMYRTDYLFLMN